MKTLIKEMNPELQQFADEITEMYEALNDCDLLPDYIDLDYIFDAVLQEAADLEEVRSEISEIIENRIFETEVIYYHKAFKFLGDHDISLRDSLNIAAEMGFSPENLNSETLATLLLQNLMLDELHENI